MNQIGGKPGAVIGQHDDETGEKTTFSFFHRFDGAIQMTIKKDNNEKIFVFESEKDFVNRAERSGLPSQFIQTVILASQI